MKLYFVRHGKTEWNLEGRFQGYSGDSALLPQALEELEILGQYLSTIPFDAIYSSDLKRAEKTAKVIAHHNLQCQQITSCSQLREWRFGQLEGTKIEDFKSAYPQEFFALKHNLTGFHHDLFGAESVEQVTQRFMEFIYSLKDTAAETILIVSHGAILTASLHRLLGFPLDQLRHRGGLDNASISILETTDFEHFTELAWNDTSYKSH